MKRIGLLLLLAGVVTANCTFRYANVPKLSMISAEPVDGKTFKMSDYERQKGEVSGLDKYSIILFIPLQGPEQMIDLNRVKRAVRNACNKQNAQLMTNVRVYTSGYYIPLIYGEFKIIIKGEAWTKKGQAKLIKELKQTPELAQAEIISAGAKQ